MKTGEQFHGFTVTRVRENEELRGTLYEMTYEKTGTELVWLDNGEENKLFGIAFLTTPEDSTGVFHILEHSVLCGSEKYPVKEPFVDLLKSSMNTFLNALTYPDKTVYPVSSRNSRDFLNLTGVYLDAVFAPKLLENPAIFRQEGIRIEPDETGELSFNGVVFNEMKGAMSSVDSIAGRGFQSLLFPDNCYHFNSGGAPESIPELTYERFTAAYRKYYHPSNARVYLDGAIPAEETFSLLESYLSRYERTAPALPPAMQTPKPCRAVNYYEPDDPEDIADRGWLTLGKIVCDWSETAKQAAISVLCDALAGTNEAPLKRALLSSGLAQDMYMDISDGISQCYLEIGVQNYRDGAEDEILALLCDTARKLAGEGLDRRMLEASFNSAAFQWRDTPEPAALERGGNALDSWLYGGDPLLTMQAEPDIEAVGQLLEEGGFDALLLELLGSPETLSVLATLPSASLAEEREQAEQALLMRKTAGWTEADYSRLAAENEALRRWQNTPDSPEASATIPVLELSEIAPVPSFIPTEQTELLGVPVLYHRLPARGIVHFGLYFSMEHCTPGELTLLSLFSTLPGNLATENYSAAALQQEFRRTVGKLNITTELMNAGGNGAFLPVLAVRGSVLREKLDPSLELTAEVLLRTDWSDKEKIREIFLQDYDTAKRSAVTSGHSLSVTVAQSGASDSGYIRECMSGATAIHRLGEFTAGFDGCIDGCIETVRRCLDRILCRAGLTVGITSQEPADFSRFLNTLPAGAPCAGVYTAAALPSRRAGCRIPAAVGFAGRACTLPGGAENYSGSLQVASNILTLDYLWNNVRVRGGAYGAGLSVNRAGRAIAYSYRDPNPAATLGIMEQAGDFLRAFADSGESVDRYILSTMAAFDPLLSVAGKGYRADRDRIAGIDEAFLTAEWQQMLRTDKAALLSAACAMDAMKGSSFCVTAGETLLCDCGVTEQVEL